MEDPIWEEEPPPGRWTRAEIIGEVLYWGLWGFIILTLGVILWSAIRF
jgi:hypothetical protein